MKTQLGHYDIVAELGRGGMGVVYKGYESSLHRYVAIKVLAESLAHDASVKERFLREARSMAALNDPHIIQIYFIGEHEGQTFFVMEFVEGESLGSLLKREGRLAPAQAAKVIHQTAQGLAAAHDKGVIHRDIKPGNLMINSRGQVKIADFGIALVAQDFSKKLTSTGEFVGTPGYLSPEVCLGKPVDQRSDIFSLGIVLFEMLTGRMPFTDESPLGLMLEVVKAEIPDVRELNNDVDPELSRILAKMIAKEPADRYPSCQELVADLARHPALAAGQTLTLQPKVSPAAATVIGMKTPAPAEVSLPVTAPTPRPQGAAPASPAAAPRPSVLDRPTVPGGNRSRSAALPIGIAASLLVAAGAGAYAFRDRIPMLQQWLGNASTSVAQDTPAATPAATTASTPVPAASNAVTSTPAPATGEAATSTAVAASGTPAASAAGGESGPANPATSPADVAGSKADGVAANVATPAVEPPPALPVGAHDATVAGPEPRASRVDALRDLAAARAAEGATRPQVARIAEPDRPVAPARPHVPTIAVFAGGDDVISEPVQQEVSAMLQRHGFNVIDEAAVPRVGHMLGGGRPDFAGALAAVARSGRVDAVVFINAKPVGTQELNYYGQSSTLYTVQLGVRAYNVGEKRMLGPGWSQQVNFTTLNASEKAREAIGPVIDEVESNLGEFRPRRGRG